MKNYHNYVGVLIIALTINACSMGYSEQDEKVAAKYCSCYNDAAKQSVKIQDWYEKNFEKLEDLKEEKKAANDDPDKEFDAEVDVIMDAEEMIEDYMYAKKVAGVCYNGYKSTKGYDDADGVVKSICHSTFYAINSGESKVNALDGTISFLTNP